MTLAETIQALLDPLATGGAWFMDNTQDPPAFPYIVWLYATSSTNVTLSGPSDLQNTRLQIDLYDKSAQGLQTLEAGVRSAMQASGLTNVPLTSFDASVPELRAFRRVMEFSVWFKG
jgi:hypothetical protein